jgi:predicted neutral ceramidase superfamily lipid hydrolase
MEHLFRIAFFQLLLYGLLLILGGLWVGAVLLIAAYPVAVLVAWTCETAQLSLRRAFKIYGPRYLNNLSGVMFSFAVALVASLILLEKNLPVTAVNTVIYWLLLCWLYKIL